MTSMSSLEFDRDAGKAQQLAENGPVFITDHGEASYVLLSINEYNKLAGPAKAISDNPPLDDDVNFNPPHVSDSDFRPVEFD